MGEKRDRQTCACVTPDHHQIECVTDSIEVIFLQLNSTASNAELTKMSLYFQPFMRSFGYFVGGIIVEGLDHQTFASVFDGLFEIEIDFIGARCRSRLGEDDLSRHTSNGLMKKSTTFTKRFFDQRLTIQIQQIKGEDTN